jgi:hypothetical protein
MGGMANTMNTLTEKKLPFGFSSLSLVRRCLLPESIVSLISPPVSKLWFEILRLAHIGRPDRIFFWSVARPNSLSRRFVRRMVRVTLIWHD